MTMTVGQLKQLLEDYDDDRPILAVHQPSWPLAENIVGLAVYENRYDENGDNVDADPADVDGDEDATPVWLVVSGHQWDRSPYGPRWAFDSVDA